MQPLRVTRSRGRVARIPAERLGARQLPRLAAASVTARTRRRGLIWQRPSRARARNGLTNRRAGVLTSGVTDHPRGTVTFLFSDVEGSTRLLKRLRDRYGAVLSEHRRLLREAFAAHGGEEVDAQGDACFYVFSRAREAAAAAAAAQRSLAAHEWPDGAALRVRMGMHTGEPNVSEDGRYHGLGVHRAARIMAAGHGAQVLASQATASVLSDDELDGITLRDLGEHELKDFERPERIYQLEIDGLPRQFAPLKVAVPREDFDLLAASLRADARDVRTFVEVLAEKFDAAFPDVTYVERGGFRGSGRVRTINVELGEHRYRLDARGPQALRSHVVRGITLRNDDLGLDEWIDSLAHDLAKESARTERGRLALEALLHE
jgi:class 3 adenylate cyclase